MPLTPRLLLPTWSISQRGSELWPPSRILKERFGLGEKEVAFFDLFASPPATFEADALRVIQQGLDCGIEPSLIQRAARLLQAYELMYWDTLRGARTSDEHARRPMIVQLLKDGRGVHRSL